MMSPSSSLSLFTCAILTFTAIAAPIAPAGELSNLKARTTELKARSLTVPATISPLVPRQPQPEADASADPEPSLAELAPRNVNGVNIAIPGVQVRSDSSATASPSVIEAVVKRSAAAVKSLLGHSKRNAEAQDDGFSRGQDPSAKRSTKPATGANMGRAVESSSFARRSGEGSNPTSGDSERITSMSSPAVIISRRENYPYSDKPVRGDKRSLIPGGSEWTTSMSSPAIIISRSDDDDYSDRISRGSKRSLTHGGSEWTTSLSSPAATISRRDNHPYRPLPNRGEKRSCKRSQQVGPIRGD